MDSTEAYTENGIQDNGGQDKVCEMIGEWQTIAGNVPSKSNSYRIVTFKSKDGSQSYSHLAKTKDLTKYERDFKLQCVGYRNAEIDQEFCIEVKVYYRRAQSDLDGVFKALLDCLQEVNAIKNDNKCVRIHAEKYIDPSNPRVEFRITLFNHESQEINTTGSKRSASPRASKSGGNKAPQPSGSDLFGHTSECPI